MVARKWMVISLAVAGLVIGLLLSVFQPAAYRGEAKVLVSGQSAGSSIIGAPQQDLSANQDREIATQVELIQQRPIAESVIGTLGLKTTPEQLLTQVKAAGDGQTNIVTIDVTGATPKLAANIANGFADAYVAYTQESRRASIKQAAAQVQANLDKQAAALASIEASIALGGPAGTAARAQLPGAQNVYNTLAGKLEDLRINQQVEAGSVSVVARAEADPAKVSPNPLRNSALGLAIGLLVGLAVAFGAQAMDTTMRTSEQIEEIYAAPILGRIPLEKMAQGETRRLTVVQQPMSVASEAYRNVRNNLNFINFEGDIKTLLVASAGPDEGKSTVAANLAAVLAQAGWSVVFVSSDFRRPTAAEFFEIDGALGVSDVLAGTAELDDVLQTVEGLDELLVLAPGRMPPNPSELLGSMAMQRMLVSLREKANWVIIDTPPVLAVADAAATARWTDGVLMVARSGLLKTDSAHRALESLGNVGAKILGVIVVGVEDRAASESYHGYSDSTY
jgi:capsular exopolysaccharide synthesis family protein